MNDKYEMILEEKANTPFGKCTVRLVKYNKPTGGKKYVGLNMEKDLFPQETKWASTPIFYTIIRAIIEQLVLIQGKSEVEKELGIKI